MSKENEVKEILANDGDASLFFWMPESTEETFAMIGVADGGGYSSVIVTAKDWVEIRAKMDALVKKYLH